GYMPPTKGTVHIEGVDIFDNPLQAKKMIGYLPENPPLYLDMTVAEYLDFVADIKQVKRKEKKSRIFYVLDKCGLSDVRKRIIGHLSKGYRQRVGIAQALVNNPSVLILDEPTIGLDPLQIIEIRDLIKSLSGERTVILSTHILPEVTMICSKVVIINEGKMVLEESLNYLSESLRNSSSLLLRVKQNGDGVKEKIMSVKGVSGVKPGPSGEFVVTPSEGVEIREELVRLVVENDLGLLELRPLVNTLEEIFMKAISSEGN
ncbi:MAG TPA: ATP-binding cassette domain-containing protein, partial [Thermodesulfobacteriota bacterium]|nr:ATP-binding cassette domain-containing protein [Thermodesulfobacteriota bacterium]